MRKITVRKKLSLETNRSDLKMSLAVIKRRWRRTDRRNCSLMIDKQHEAVIKKEQELKEKITELEDVLKKKNTSITNAERTIYSQKKRTGELEKFKYVLDFKIKELKKDMLPREREIAYLKTETTLVDSELKDMNVASNLLGDMV